jgi:hypothetical protein
MALVLKDRVKETTATTSTGTYTLAGAVVGYQAFSVIGDGNTTYYAITNGTDWEVGIGTYTASGTTLSRDTILESSNSGNAVNWGAGVKDIFCTYPAERSMYVDGTTITPAISARLGFANLAQGSALSVLGVTGNATADNASIAAGTDHQVLRRSGTSLAFGAVNLAQSAAITGTLPVANGGTGQTSYTDGQLLIGNTTGNTLAKATLTAGTGISITNGAGSITVAATNNGTVTSVGGTGTVNGITLTGTVTSSGNLTLGGTLSGVSLSTQVTGTLPIANGGSGQTTAQAAMNAFAGATTSGSYLRGNGTNVVMSTIQAGDVPTLNQNTTGSAATLTTARTFQTNLASTSAVSFNGSANVTPGVTGTLPVANGGTGVTSSTGSGSVVLSTSPSLTTPVLGTPTSGNLSNCTVDGTDAVGFRNTPVNSQSAAYTLVLADSGKTILHPIADNNARTFTIPANSSVVYPVGTVVTFINLINTVTIAITSDTMYLAGPGTTGSRTLAAYGVATAVKVASTTWIISGNGLT